MCFSKIKFARVCERKIWYVNNLDFSLLNIGFVVNGLQSVEEAECRRAYDSATEVYMASFDRSKPPEEVSNLSAYSKFWLCNSFSFHSFDCNGCRLL
jgi:hypothetical protein